MMISMPRSRHGRGWGLLETAMVLGIVAVIIAGVMRYYGSADTTRKTNDAMAQLAAVQQAARALFGGEPDYEGITASILANSKMLPNRMVKGSGASATLQHALGGAILVGTANADRYFTVQFQNIPGESCNKMATSDLGTGMTSITVTGDTTITKEGKALSPVEAGTACGEANSINITWTFY